MSDTPKTEAPNPMATPDNLEKAIEFAMDNNQELIIYAQSLGEATVDINAQEMALHLRNIYKMAIKLTNACYQCGGG